MLRFPGFESVTGHEALGVVYLLFAVVVWMLGRHRFAVDRSDRAPTAAPWMLGTVAVGSGGLAIATIILLFV